METVVQVSAHNAENPTEEEGTVITYPSAPVAEEPFGVYIGLRVGKEDGMRSRATCLRICQQSSKS